MAVRIDIYRKNDRGGSGIINYRPGDPIELENIKLSLPIERVFKGIGFEPQPEP